MITTNMFIMLLTTLSIVCSLFVEALKKVFGDKVSTNILVAIVSAIVGWGGCVCAYILIHIPFNAENIVTIFLMGPAVWLVATVGYDKVIQSITQLGKK